MKKGWLIFFVLILIGISFYFDATIVQSISSLRNVFLSDFLLGITFISSEIIVFFFLTSLFLWQEHKRKYILPLWVTLGFSVIVSLVLKILVHRQRPFQLGLVSVLPLLEKASHFIWNFSFPSFKAMLVFCAIPILSKQFPKFKYVWVIFAGLVGFSRVYFGLHFMSDVLVGALIGYLLGVLVLRLEEKTRFGEKALRIFK